MPKNATASPKHPYYAIPSKFSGPTAAIPTQPNPFTNYAKL
jgi:hypothetical protein